VPIDLVRPYKVSSGRSAAARVRAWGLELGRLEPGPLERARGSAAARGGAAPAGAAV